MINGCVKATLWTDVVWKLRPLPSISPSLVFNWEFHYTLIWNEMSQGVSKLKTCLKSCKYIYSCTLRRTFHRSLARRILFNVTPVLPSPRTDIGLERHESSQDNLRRLKRAPGVNGKRLHSSSCRERSRLKSEAGSQDHRRTTGKKEKKMSMNINQWWWTPDLTAVLSELN